jgi:hypothetical protein
MQGTAADIIKRAMIRVDAWLAGAGLDALMIMQVHDELVFEVGFFLVSPEDPRRRIRPPGRIPGSLAETRRGFKASCLLRLCMTAVRPLPFGVPETPKPDVLTETRRHGEFKRLSSSRRLRVCASESSLSIHN